MNKDLDKILINALEEEPKMMEIDDLSKKIIRRIQKREKIQRLKIIVLYIFFLLVFLGFSAAGFITYFGLGWLREMKPVLYLGALIGGLVIVIQLLDYKLIRSLKDTTGH